MVTTPHPPTSVARAESLIELASIFEPWCNIAHLGRSLDHVLADESNALAKIEWDDICTILPGNGASEGVDGTPLYAEFNRTFGRELPALRGDILFLSELLRDLTGADRIGVRLMRLLKPACPNLHFDRVGLRLVTTYSGPGTEYLPDRWAEGDPRSSINLPNRELQRAVHESVTTSSAGDVLLLKGTLWEGNEKHGAVHRSPEFCSSEPRVVATLDPL